MGRQDAILVLEAPIGSALYAQLSRSVRLSYANHSGSR
jgi:hypothetical protein